MTARTEGITASRLAAKALPIIIVASASIASRSDLAAAYPLAALLLLLWIVSDTMVLALLARNSTPGGAAVLGALAAASVTVWLGSPAPLNRALWETPVLSAGMMVIVFGHVAWGAIRARRVLARPGQDTRNGWAAALSEILPPALVRLAAAELMVIHMALFRWGGPPDVPEGARAFSYHQHLAPMCAALLILSAIEIAAYHLLVGQWNRTAAVVMFVLSDVGFVYLLGLVKSFRFRPVLLTHEGLRVRAGFLMDQFVPFAAIAGVQTSFESAQVRQPDTLNAALLAWPNMLLSLSTPLPRKGLLGRVAPVQRIALRLDDPAPFLRLLRWRLGQQAQ